MGDLSNTRGEAVHSSYTETHELDSREKRKICGIWAVQLLFTTSIVSLFTLHEVIKRYARITYDLILHLCVVTIVLLFLIGYCDDVRRKSQYNVVLLGMFTLTYGVVIGVIAATYEPHAVMLASVTTAVITICLAVFSFQTKANFLVWAAIIFCCAMVMIIFGITVEFCIKVLLSKYFTFV